MTWFLQGLPVAAWAASSGKVLVLGDSLSAEYGIARGTGWVALLAAKLQAEHKLWTVVNASISGDTTSGGRARLNALLQQHQPQVVIIELGGNDALRGLPLSATQDNLRAMVEACQARKARVLLLGMQLPPNYGLQYGRDFAKVYADVAQQRKTGWVPFMLRGIADAPDPVALFQPDRIHPLAQAHPQILANVWPELKKLL